MVVVFGLIGFVFDAVEKRMTGGSDEVETRTLSCAKCGKLANLQYVIHFFLCQHVIFLYGLCYHLVVHGNTMLLFCR